MYLYLLYLLGYYTYEENRITDSNDTPENIKFLESRAPLFPKDTTIIKNRDLITDKSQLHSNYQNVVDELKVRIKNRNDVKMKYKKVLEELEQKFKVKTN